VDSGTGLAFRVRKGLAARLFSSPKVGVRSMPSVYRGKTAAFSDGFLSSQSALPPSPVADASANTRSHFAPVNSKTADTFVAFESNPRSSAAPTPHFVL
jgi:hypothetical protein